jgi:hypothetical protein
MLLLVYKRTPADDPKCRARAFGQSYSIVSLFLELSVFAVQCIWESSWGLFFVFGQRFLYPPFIDHFPSKKNQPAFIVLIDFPARFDCHRVPG